MLHQKHEPFYVFHIEHIIAKKHVSDDSDENLCLACASCNLHKGTNIAGLDPDSGQITPLFHPREHNWDDHFMWEGPYLRAKTASARATIHVLRINSAENLELREALISEGTFP